MAKALTREDLLYILQSIFKISDKEDNAFQMLEDGLYVEDHHKCLESHTEDESLHIDAAIKDILQNISVNEDGLLLYNNNIVSLIASKKEGNSASIEPDGLYVPSVAQDAADHLINDDIHVTLNDKENWNQALQKAKEFTLEQVNKIIVYNIEIVSKLPEPIVTPDENTEEGSEPGIIITYPPSTTLYLLLNDPDCPDECTYSLYMYLQDEWHRLGISKQTLQKFALKTEVEDSINNIHKHSNLNVLDEFAENENGQLLYKGQTIREMDISDKEDNAIQIIDNKLYVRDFNKEIQSTQTGGFIKYNLYNDEINNSGVYELKDSIDKYSLILIEYYYRPDDTNENPGCAKTAVIDTDTLNYLYSKNIDYMLEYGYGILMSNSKIRMNGDKLWVDYYHNVNIYRITGIRRGDDNE